MYGLSLARILRGGRGARALKAQLVIDETTAMARGHEEAPERAFLATGVQRLRSSGTSGTLAGALLGSGIGDVRDYGLDAMFPAAFLALLAPQLRHPGAPVAAVVGAAVAVALLPFAPAGVPILAALIGLVPGVLFLRRASGAPRVTWPALLGLAAASYLLKAIGPVLAGQRELRPAVGQVLDLVAIPLLAALILIQTLDGGQQIVFDARVPALLVAGLLVWRRAPFLVVVLSAAATAALLRAVA